MHAQWFGEYKQYERIYCSFIFVGFNFQDFAVVRSSVCWSANSIVTHNFIEYSQNLIAKNMFIFWKHFACMRNQHFSFFICYIWTNVCFSFQMRNLLLYNRLLGTHDWDAGEYNEAHTTHTNKRHHGRVYEFGSTSWLYTASDMWSMYTNDMPLPSRLP